MQENSVSRGLGAAAGGSHGTYLCIKEVMKNHGLQVAKLSRFKSGPNISVSYVSFLHAARDLFTAWPAYSAHNRSEPISRIPPASSKN